MTSRLLRAALACLVIALVGVDSARAVDRMSYVRHTDVNTPSWRVELWTADLDGSNRVRSAVYREPVDGCTPDVTAPCPIGDTAVAPDGDTVAYDVGSAGRPSGIGLVSTDCGSSIVYAHEDPYVMQGGVKVQAAYVRPGLAWSPDASRALLRDVAFLGRHTPTTG